ncbi:GNAT family N-acetyltransferase [Longimicrobium sp.]|uniref:GNAT family N-acetyltransferase n=1 Tax=Longimicrobium sp. TaxID=2029185 RepID=UPI002C68D6B1|nr:GNAT family N-acetyltransferase [Longimicrobium sp.]HSU13813.1 GNAT family N-acetyltransferase [Longimicrobium sp.]
MEFHYADESDAAFLADINRQLIEDEWDGGGMSLAGLEKRMRRWLSEDEYKAILFQERGTTVAYCMLSVDEDSAYIRHFFVLHEHRSGGVGRRAVELLFREIIPPDVRVTLDVLASNRAGHRFWRSVGFTDYSVRMERDPAAKTSSAEPPPAGPPPAA